MKWTFLYVNDSHMGTPRSYRFRPAVNRRWAAIKRQMAAIDAEFLLHGGDLTRDGETHEYEYLQAREDLDTLPFPTFVVPGNMDVGNKHAGQSGRWGSDLGCPRHRLERSGLEHDRSPVGSVFIVFWTRTLDLSFSRRAVHWILRCFGRIGIAS